MLVHTCMLKIMVIHVHKVHTLVTDNANTHQGHSQKILKVVLLCGRKAPAKFIGHAHFRLDIAMIVYSSTDKSMIA